MATDAQKLQWLIKNRS